MCVVNKNYMRAGLSVASILGDNSHGIKFAFLYLSYS